MTCITSGAKKNSGLRAQLTTQQSVEKLSSQTVQKDLRGEAREKSILRLRSGQAEGGIVRSRRSGFKKQVPLGCLPVASYRSMAIERDEAYEAFSTV